MAIYNIISYMKSLKDAGVPEAQAAIHAHTLSEFMDNNLASKEDLRNTEHRLDVKIDRIEERLNLKIDHVEQKLGARINQVEHKMEAKMETMRTDLSARINTIDVKLDWLIRLIGLISVVFAAINFFHLYGAAIIK